MKSVASQTFEGKSESARDVSFSPNQTDFAAAFENGTIQVNLQSAHVSPSQPSIVALGLANAQNLRKETQCT